jgi:hypothetical protein
MDAIDGAGLFAAYATDETGFYLDRRLQAQVWNSYADERCWLRAAAQYESKSASAGARDRMRRLPMRRLRLAALLVLGLVSMMASSAQAASPDVQHAEGVVATLPAASSPQAAEANQAALAPSVRASIAAGHGRELLETTTSPDVRADVLRYGATTTTIGSPPSRYSPPVKAARHKQAHAAGCYGSPWSQTSWTVAGGTIGWLYVRENGWCGQSGYIYWYGGATFASWSWGIYCFANKGADYSWDGYPAWIHMAHWATLGVSYPWGCVGISGGKVQQRIAWTGYWDRYNDYGF